MTSLKRISISGIRSYEPNNHESINFNSDVTIIHGHNGSGKTSLLESMKWCLSGQYPPTSNNGKTFIADPRVKQGFDNVQAVVEATIGNSENNFHIKRTMQMTLKNDKHGNATGSLSTESPWVKVENLKSKEVKMLINQKNRKKAESDEKVLEVIGVNKSVLDYVVFCHQEMSDWPLCEPKVLKERMDQIFSVDKYSKQIEYYQKLIKSRKDGEELQTLHVNNYRENLNQYCKMMENKFNAETDLEEFKSEIGKIKEKLDDDKEGREGLRERGKKFRDLKERLKVVLKDDLKGKAPSKSIGQLESELESLVNDSNEEKLAEVIEALSGIKDLFWVKFWVGKRKMKG